MPGDFFYTTSDNERETAQEGYGYQAAVPVGYIPFVRAAGTTPLFRLHRADSGLHFYTTASAEHDQALTNGYVDEGVAGFLYTQPAPETVPLYRLRNPQTNTLFFTTLPEERAGQAGFQDEGTAGYLFAQPAQGCLPFYRLAQAADVQAALPARIRGFVDTHNHQFADQGFGGMAFVGSAFGPIEHSLPHCEYAHGIYGLRDVLGEVRAILDKSGGVGHRTGGYPHFDGWPRWNDLTHQSVYQDWLYRALQGGLKLIVVLAVNSELVANVATRALGRSADDMEAVDYQIRAARTMEAYIDQQCGGPGQGWYRIVAAPQQAREVIAAGKLAVVLGIEVDHVFGQRADAPLAPQDLLAKIAHYYDLGVRHIFPIHFANNGFGGTAFQNPLIGDPALTETLVNDPVSAALNVAGWPYEITTRLAAGEGYAYRGGRVNAYGLTGLGKFFIQALMSRGMLIDTDHMSAASFKDTLDIADAYQYPIISSHTGFIDISLGDRLHEGNMQARQAERIRRSGGMISCILNQGSITDLCTWHGLHQVTVEHTCGGSSETWVQAYLYASEKMEGGPVGFGSDFNGMISPSGPRFGPEACPRGKSPSHAGQHAPDPVIYPFSAAATGSRLDHSQSGTRTFDVNVDGVAHIGMLPDFIADLQQLGLTPADLDPLLSSAEGYIQAWERAERHKPAVPALPFPSAPNWAQMGSGFLHTPHHDLIRYQIELGLGAADSVEFIVELNAGLTREKQLVLAAGDGQQRIIKLGGGARTGQDELRKSQLSGGTLLFWKEKGLLVDEGMEQVLEVGNLDDLPDGSRVTFTWIRDLELEI